MSTNEELIIDFSKTKIAFLTLGSIAFVVAGFWMFNLDEEAIKGSARFSSPALVHGIGVLSIVFFGLCGIFGLGKLFNDAPGIILNTHGISDNSSGVSTGDIPWTEITGIEQFSVHKQKFIAIYVKHPENYLELGNAVQNAASQASLKLYGTPLTISANSLKIKFDDLLEVMREYYDNNSADHESDFA